MVPPMNGRAAPTQREYPVDDLLPLLLASGIVAHRIVAPGRIELQDRPIPKIGSTDVLLRVTTTTICGADVHILKGEHSFTHRYKLNQIEEAYDLCTHQRDGVLKVAITP